MGFYSPLSPHPRAMGFQVPRPGEHGLGSCPHVLVRSQVGDTGVGGAERHSCLAYGTLFPTLRQETAT